MDQRDGVPRTPQSDVAASSVHLRPESGVKAENRPLTQGGERKLAAIVAADVAGYSRLMGIDEVGTARRLRECQTAVSPIVREHGGRVVNIAGDGMLLEFLSVINAVQCAVAIQRLMAQRNDDIPDNDRMLLRVGIDIGDVLIQGEDILGVGVNIAARLESFAEPGGICVSRAVYEQSKASWSLILLIWACRSSKTLRTRSTSMRLERRAARRSTNRSRSTPMHRTSQSSFCPSSA